MSELNIAELDALRFLQMVGELHKLGYDRIRIAAGMSPSGIHWRCSITHSQNVQEDGWEPIADKDIRVGSDRPDGSTATTYRAGVQPNSVSIAVR